MDPVLPEHPDSLSLDLLDRVLAGEMTESDRVALAHFAQQQPAGALLLDRFRAHYLRSASEPARLGRMRDEAMGQITTSALPRPEFIPLREKGSRSNVTRIGEDFKTRTLRRGMWYTLTGVTACILTIVLGWHVGTPRLGGHGSLAVTAYVTGNGQRANITLPDGNTVALNVASRLEVPADYLTGNHKLHLNGEALFAIGHQTGTPFTVIAGADTARVLGTNFVVRHYSNDATARIAVREGKLAVYAGAVGSVVLTAGRQVAIDRVGGMQLGEAEPRQFSFAAGVLTFTGGLLRDAIPDLDRWYDADIRLGDSTLLARRLTGEYAAGSLSDLIAILEGTYNVRVVRAGRVLTLYRR